MVEGQDGCYWEKFCNKSCGGRYFWVIRTKICWLESYWEIISQRKRVIFRKKLGSDGTGKVELKGVPCVPPVGL